ncbi:MAG: UPF0182 family protein [Actinobacteria bacterium]|nr:UPF0182 family protein [Actinomycetota bacterium]MCL5882767.1 UPF0182 family protein [Actinomycetota bacterium]
MKPEPYEPFSKIWDRLAKLLKLDQAGPPPEGNVRPIRTPKKKNPRRRWFWAILGVVIIFLLVLFGRGVYLYTEWLWFGEVGYRGVFWKTLLTQVGLFFGAGAVFFLVVYGNIMLARRFAPRYKVGPNSELTERGEIPDQLVRVLIPAFLLLPTLIAAGVGAAAWEGFLKFFNGASFGTADPVFGRDIGFYLFSLPFLRTLQSFFWWTLIFTFLVTVAMHFFDYAITWSQDRIAFAPHVKAHLSVLLGLAMLVLGAGYLLKGYVLMFSPRGVVFGASYTDVHAQLPVYKFLAVVALIAGILFFINIYFRGWTLPVLAIGIIVLTAIFAGKIYPFIVQQYQVSPNELDKESQYIQYNIDFTRMAFNLEPIQDQAFAAVDNLTPADIQANTPTTNNIRLWEPRTLGQTYNQIQVIRPYYGFQDIDVDRYMINGKLQQVMLSAREMKTSALPATAQTWQNQHLVYTHGYGIAMSTVAQATAEGLPQLIIKDIPPVSSFPELTVQNPAVYYGQMPSDYVVVKSGTEEFDYPKGDENVYTTYSGSGGVNISSLFSRAAFSWRFASLKLLVSSSIESDSRIMIHRDIGDRIRNVAPFLQYDRDPYSVLVDGRLFWIQDAYTTSSEYPYSQPDTNGTNYIRNSVKVVVDAYNGDVKFYMVDPSDPVVQTYSNIFPGLFTPGDQMPEALRLHLRYPEDLFNIQAQMYATYHMTDPRVFYNKEDLWSISQTQDGGRSVQMDPYYVIMKLPGEDKEQFMLLLPFSPNGRDNMIAWMAAKCDPGQYGDRLVYKFPKDKLIYGPTQIQARFNQDPTISGQITLLNQQGSTVAFGNLLVIPVNDSIIYVEPLYLKAANGQIPELKRVLVSYGGQVAMEVDLSTALQKIFGAQILGLAQNVGQPGTATTTTPAAPGTTTAPAASQTIKQLADAAAAHYNNAVNAQKNGDWTTYGNELKALQDTLNQLQAAAAAGS